MFYMLDQDFTFMFPRNSLLINKVTVIKKNGNFTEHCNKIKKHELIFIEKIYRTCLKPMILYK
jgi:hypothetical protein